MLVVEQTIVMLLCITAIRGRVQRSISTVHELDITPSAFFESSCQLGEAPYWEKRTARMYWLDILKKELFFKRIDGPCTRVNLPATFTSFFVEGTQLLGCTENGFARFDTQTYQYRELVDIESDLPTNRSNDGCADGHGGFLFGTMDWEGDRQTGSIYHVNLITHSVVKLDDNYFIPNGFVLLRETSRLLIADSYLGHIYTYDYDPEAPALSNKRLFADISSTGYSPDGMAGTDNGTIWSAEWGGSRLTEYDQSGKVLRRVHTPVPRPTSCCMGGEEGNLLFVTSACVGLTQEALATYPRSGSVFFFDLAEVE